MRLAHLTFVEMRRALHRRLVWSMCLLAVAGCAFVGVVAFVSSNDPAELATTSDHPAHMVTWWVAGTAEGFLLLAAVFLALGAAICGASVAGAEWKAGTVTTNLTWEPSRVRFQVARSLSAAILAFFIAIVLQIVFLAALLPAVWAHGNTAGTDSAWWSSLLFAVLRTAGIASLVALLALSIATIGRNTVAALVAIAAWALIGEGLVRGYRPETARWLISENVATIIPWKELSGAEFERGPGVALATLCCYVVFAGVVALLSFTRRDIAGV
jgi:hypothetical protein